MFVFNTYVSCADEPKPQVCPQTGHSAIITDIAVSQVKNIFASASMDGTIKIWNHHGLLIRTLSGHTDEISSIAFTPDGEYLLSGGYDRKIIKWDLSGRIIWTSGKTNRRKPGGNDDDSLLPVKCIAISPDGHTIAAARTNCIEFLDESGMITNVPFPSGVHKGSVNALSFSPDGLTLASGADDGEIKYWDIKGNLLRTIESPFMVTALVWNKDGSILASGHDEGTLFLHNADGSILREITDLTKKERRQMGKPSRKYVYIQFDNTYTLFACCEDGCCLTHNVKNNKTIVSNIQLNGACLQKIIYLYNSFIGAILNNLFYLPFSADTGRFVMMPGHFGYFGGVAVNPSNGALAVWTGDEILTFRNDLSKSVSIKLPADKSGHSAVIDTIVFEPSGNSIISIDNYRGIVHKTDGSKSIVIPNIMFGNTIELSRDKAIIYSSDSFTHYISGFDFGTGKWETVGTFPHRDSTITYTAICPETAYTAAYNDGKIYLSDWAGKSCIIDRAAPLNFPDYIVSLSFSPDGKLLATLSEYGFLMLFETTGRMIASKTTFSYSSLGNNRDLSPEKHNIESGIVNDQFWNSLDAYDILIDIFPNQNIYPVISRAIAWSNDGRILTTGSWDGTVRVWDRNGLLVKSFDTGAGPIRGITFSPDGERLFIVKNSSEIIIINIINGSKAVFFTDRTAWILYTDDGYWDASGNGGYLVALIDGIKAYAIDQFAAQTNRPDIIYKRLGLLNDETVSHYRNQYKKRLAKIGLIPARIDIKEFEGIIRNNPEKNLIIDCYVKSSDSYFLKDEVDYFKKRKLIDNEKFLNYVESSKVDYHAPSAHILKIKQDGKFADLVISFIDDKYELKSYNIYINDVPLYGAYGTLKGLNTTDKSETVTLTERIELSAGDNKIEVSCMNEKGAESFRALTYAKYDTQIKSSLYYIGFGVSTYRDSSINLQFAHKDVLDLAETFKSMKEKYENIYVYTFINEKCTVENIKKAKGLLKNAGPDDLFVLFISGHGIHDCDDEATYYYVTYETDLKNLSGTAANFEMIEDILQGIGPRNKLFLMDTCESGEIDEDVIFDDLKMAKQKGIMARFIPVSENSKTVLKMKIPIKSRNKRTYLYQKNRYIYNDLVRRSGSIVFSSCRGGELSYEDKSIKNGFFSHSIIEYFRKNKGRFIGIDELKEYVMNDVMDKTGGMQHPTIDRDNIYQRFGFYTGN